MSPPLQQRLLPVFHFALNPDGFLVLGLAETVGQFGDLFELVNREHKIYRRRRTGHRPPLTFMSDRLAGRHRARRMPAAAAMPPADFLREAERLVDRTLRAAQRAGRPEFEVQQYRGRTAPFLESPGGQPTTNLLRMAKEGLFQELRSALTEAKATRAPVVRDELRVADARQPTRVHVARAAGDAAAITRPAACWCCSSRRTRPAWSAAAACHARRAARRPNATSPGCARNWPSNREYLQSIVDQQESADQELRAAHEEVLSSNEELQSTNEELETTKEELQSANEELTTVNEQFQPRTASSTRCTEDLSNFISSAELPMVTVGRDLRDPAPDAGRAARVQPAARPTSAARWSTSSSTCRSTRIGDVDSTR